MALCDAERQRSKGAREKARTVEFKLIGGNYVDSKAGAMCRTRCMDIFPFPYQIACILSTAGGEWQIY